MNSGSLLFLSHHSPFPPDSGGRIRTYHTLSALTRDFSVHLICLDSSLARTSGKATRDPAGVLDELETVTTVHSSYSASAFTQVKAHSLSIVTKRPYTDYLYDWKLTKRTIADLLDTTSIDLVHADTYHLSPVFPLFGDIPLVCTFHDLQSQILRRRAEVEDSRIKSLYLRHQADILEDSEYSSGECADLNVVVSERDREVLFEFGISKPVDVIPNGLPMDRYPDAHPDGIGNRVVFVGGGNWFPNRDGMRFFVRKILPYLENIDGVSILWVGTTDERLRKEFSDVPNLHFTGHVKEIAPYMRSATCVIVPLRCGSGTRLKILEAWAMGKAVVTTSIGCEGLRATDEDNLLIRDTPRGFAEGVRRVLRDGRLRRHLSQNGRRTMREKYAWENIATDLCDLYTTVVC